MKKAIVACVILLVVAVPSSFAQVGFRADLGLSAIIGLGAAGSGGSGFYTWLDGKAILPYPNGAVYVQGRLGAVKLAAGLKVIPAIIVNIAYPAVLAEFDLGPLAIEASLGGLVFGYWIPTVGADILTGGLLLPEVSAWFAFGSKRQFRVGGGVLAFTEDFTAAIFLIELGFKVVLD